MTDSKIYPETMVLWSAVCKTDPAHTKHVNQRGGYTAIDPTYQTMQATKEFGPYGTGWGLRNIEYDYGLLDRDLPMVLIHAEFFYPGGAFEISNAISPTMGKTGIADTDFAKKLETNTISKALSRLGFNADVFMGQFEDHQYLEHRTQEAALEKAEDRTKERMTQQQAYEEEMARLLEQIAGAVSLSMLKGIYTSALRKATFKEDQKMIVKLERAKNQRKAELEAIEAQQDQQPNQQQTNPVETAQ